MRVSDDLLGYYERELAYLRERGGEFAQRYPKVASRMALAAAESTDPHTERLIEACAFLAARVHRDLDREAPLFASSLLDHICPSLGQPVPSMSVAQITLDPTQGKVTAGFAVPRHTALLAHGADGSVCRLRTAWDTVLWPLQVVDVRLVEGRQLHVGLRCDEGVDLSELELDALRLHVHGDATHAMSLYELLACSVSAVSVRTGAGSVHRLGLRHWRELGFDDGHEVLPLPAHTPPAYGLLQEYFAFPRKFHFFEISGLRHRLGTGRDFTLCLDVQPPAGAAAALGALDAGSLRTGCVPIINLFSQTSEPLRIDHRQHEHLLVADRQHAASTEVHSVLSVMASDPDAERCQRVPPFGALDTRSAAAQGGVFWTARREASLRPGRPGSEVWLALVDPGHAPARPSEPVVYAQLLCTNGRLAEQLPAGTRLRAEGLSAALQVRCLVPPSAHRAAPLAAQALWQLVALMRLNHGSLVGCHGHTPGADSQDVQDGAASLRGMLQLFCDGSARDLAQIRGVRTLDSRPGTARIGHDAWRGHCRGTDVTLGFDEDAFVGGSPLLLSAVLARFFALYTTVNSFVRVSVHRRDELWKQWPPIAGHQALI